MPAPITTVRSAPGGASRTAWTPFASGSISAPTRIETSSGSRRASAARTFTKSANAPGTCTPTSTRSGHRFVSPARHRRHSPQPDSGLTATRAPCRSCAPSPVAITVPANSCPITSGGTRFFMWPT